MKSSRFAVLTGVVLFVLCLPDAFGWDAEYKQGFALSRMIKSSDLVVVGRVAGKGICLSREYPR